MQWILTWDDVDNIGWGDAPEYSQNVAHAREDNRDSADSCLEASGANYVECGWEVLPACDHKVKGVAEGNVIEHDVRSHCWKH